MAKGCKRYLDFEEAYYPDHTCITTGQPPCEVCLVQEQVPAFEREIESLRAQLAAANEAKERAERERDHAEAILEYQVRSEKNTPAWDLFKRKAERAEAAEQKTAELAAEVQRMREAFVGIMVNGHFLNCPIEKHEHMPRSPSVMQCEAIQRAISSPAAQVLAERDSRIWREAAQFLRDYGAIAETIKVPYSDIIEVFEMQAAAITNATEKKP